MCYYLCCFGCCGLCCQKSSKQKNKDKQKTLKVLERLSIRRKKLDNKSINPLRVKTTDISDFYDIPNSVYKTPEQLIESKGYKLLSKLGSGVQGEVYEGIHIETQLRIACKQIEIPSDLDDSAKKRRLKRVKDMKNELFVMESIRHPHLIHMIMHFVINYYNITKLYILMELATNGTLRQLARSEGPFDENQCKTWFAQMLSAMSCMHSNGIAHEISNSRIFF